MGVAVPHKLHALVVKVIPVLVDEGVGGVVALPQRAAVVNHKALEVVRGAGGLGGGGGGGEW